MEHYNSEITKATTPTITTTANNSIDIHKQQQQQQQQLQQLKKQQELLEENQQRLKEQEQVQEEEQEEDDKRECEHEEKREYHRKQQQQHNEQQQQQFCLRWHNHQTSLLSTLPILLDQCQLTDVTISAEGRTLRAHRVVLSACSTFFLEIFRSLDTNNHPVIIIPGASFAAIVALLTFMYSGEVNVYEEQIPVLLSLAETLGIKGLTDVHNNDYRINNGSLWQQNDIKVESNDNSNVEEPSPPCSKIRKVTTPQAQSQPQPQTQTQSQSQPLHQTQQQPQSSLQLESQSQMHPSVDTTSSLFQSLLNHKLATLSTTRSSTSSPVTSASIMSTPLENLFLRSLQFYPNLLQQPLNFTQMALDKYEQQQYLPPVQFNAAAKEFTDECSLGGLSKRFSLNDDKKQQQQKDLKRIDKIVDNLKDPSNATPLIITDNKKTPTVVTTPLRNLHNSSSATSTATATTAATATAITSTAVTSMITSSPNKSVPLCYTSNMQNRIPLSGFKSVLPIGYNTSTTLEAGYRMESIHKTESPLLNVKDTRQGILGSQIAPPVKTCSNSKLYATCFICHKQLSNQYNLRVHLETHQNVRYACNVCPHVSRSKDALRKHVSYRHPGVPSPCETETRRKRSSKVLNTIKTGLATSSVSSLDNSSTTSPNVLASMSSMSPQSALHIPITAPVSTETETMNSVDAVAHLKSAAFMFLPNQYHLAVAAAAAAADQHKLNTYLMQKDAANTFEHKTNIFGEINQPPTTSSSSSTASVQTPTTCTELTSSSVFELTKCLQSNNNNNNNNNEKNLNPNSNSNAKTPKKLCSVSDCEKLVRDEVTSK